MKMKVFSICSMFGFAIMVCHAFGILLLPRWVLFVLPIGLFLLSTLMGTMFEREIRKKDKTIRQLERLLLILKKENSSLKDERKELKAENRKSNELQKKTALKLEVATNAKNLYKKQAQRNPYNNTGT